ncbi:GNAT family N-acetyltransferase [Sphingomonas segetis]|jgi:ribosomal-protein-alanine N-acetyltransferase|uniref:GNAT family N-acetyltransferase n=1 Tax=Sphingomonas segetis TaxID=1104779 RepID=UPI0012D36EB3|nr:GNAT family N-acetyltransferase [Sphingomonas segetis]
MATPALAEDIRIAPGTPDQIGAVMQVMEAAFGDRFGEAWTRSQLSGILPMAGVLLTLAVERARDAVVGFSLVRTVADESELLLLAVLPDEQRRGVGGLLLDHFIDGGRDAGLRRVHLEVRDGNPAIGMYQRAGFAPVGRRRNYYHASDGKRYDAITLACEL